MSNVKNRQRSDVILHLVLTGEILRIFIATNHVKLYRVSVKKVPV